MISSCSPLEKERVGLEPYAELLFSRLAERKAL